MDRPSEKSRRFEALVLEHHVRVRAFVRSLGVEPDWVDDVAQEAFMTAYRDWESFDPSRDFGKWVRGIAANLVRNELRKNARRQRLLHSDLASMLLERHASWDANREPVAVVAVQECLEQLPPKHREIVQGRYRDGLSAPELATRFEQTATNIRQILVRIRRQLRACVERHLASEA